MNAPKHRRHFRTDQSSNLPGDQSSPARESVLGPPGRYGGCASLPVRSTVMDMLHVYPLRILRMQTMDSVLRPEVVSSLPTGGSDQRGYCLGQNGPGTAAIWVGTVLYACGTAHVCTYIHAPRSTLHAPRRPRGGWQVHSSTHSSPHRETRTPEHMMMAGSNGPVANHWSSHTRVEHEGGIRPSMRSRKKGLNKTRT